ncbi:MAG: kelch repeat-containing protein, partial [Rhodothermales bacterium]
MKSRYLWLLFSWLLVSSPVDSARAQTAAKWQARSAMATARSGLMAVEHQGRIYVIGGRDANGDVLDLVERYNPASDTWETFPSLRKGRENGAAVVYNGQLMVIGGHTNSDETTKDVEVFDEGENRWVSFSGLDEARQGLAAVVLHGELYVVGGSNENEQILTSVESYDPNDTKWVPSDWVLDIPRASFTAVTLGDSAYALGGFNAFGPMNLVQLYTSELGTIDRAPLAVARGGLSAVTLDGRILALGGRKANNQVVASVDRYDPVSNSWQALAPLNAGRESFAAVTVGDEVYVFGGEDTAGNALSSVESYSVLPAPSAIDDALVLDEDVSASVNVLINDSDPLGGALAIGGFSQGAHGAVTKVNNSTLQYVPAPNYAGSDSFTYTAVNQSGISSTGTVSVTVRAVNDPPAFVTSPVEGALTGASYVYDVTVGDVDGDALTLGATVPAWLSLVDNGDGTGTLAGTPTASELGSHNVVLTVGDGTVTVQQAFTVTVVAGAPAAPVLTFPADGALDMALRLALTWSAPGASTSDVQVSTSSDFS